MTIARTPLGRRPVTTVYPTMRSSTSTAPRLRRTPAARSSSQTNPASTAKCCPEMASAWTTPVRT